MPLVSEDALLGGSEIVSDGSGVSLKLRKMAITEESCRMVDCVRSGNAYGSEKMGKKAQPHHRSSSPQLPRFTTLISLRYVTCWHDRTHCINRLPN